MPSLSNKLKMAFLQHRQRLLASTTQAKHLKSSAVTAHAQPFAVESVTSGSNKYLQTMLSHLSF
jgi:hypothetical protein